MTSRLNADEVEKLRATTEELAQRLPAHNEAQLTAGRVNLLALRMHVLDLLGFKEDEQYGAQWSLTHPEATLLLLGMKDEKAKPVQTTIANSTKRRELLLRSTECFAAALRSCPLDGRAAWGCYLGGLGQSSVEDEELVGSFLMLLNRNNPEIIFKAGLAAVAYYAEGSPQRELGVRLLQLSAALQAGASDRLMAVALPYLSSREAKTLLPKDDIALLCKAAQSFATMSRQEQELAQELVNTVYPKLKDATARDQAGWRAMAWVAQQRDDLQLAITFMNRTLVTGKSNAEDRFALAELHYEAGDRNEANRQLESIRDKYPQHGERVDQLKDKWRRSVDQVQ